MKLFNFMITDYEEVVDMYYEFTKEIYPDRQVGYRYFFYKEVMKWINHGNDIVVAKSNGDIVGFSMAYVDDNNGLTETIYNGVLAYVKTEYRKTRAAYLLYNNMYSLAKEKNLTVIANGLVTNGVSDMIKKHFDCKEMFINFERNKNESI